MSLMSDQRSRGWRLQVQDIAEGGLAQLATGRKAVFIGNASAILIGAMTVTGILALLRRGIGRRFIL